MPVWQTDDDERRILQFPKHFEGTSYIYTCYNISGFPADMFTRVGSTAVKGRSWFSVFLVGSIMLVSVIYATSAISAMRTSPCLWSMLSSAQSGIPPPNTSTTN